MLKFTKRRALVVLGVVSALAVATAAIAYWTAGGSGSGTASTATGAGSLTVNQTSSLTDMYPGDSTQTLSGDFDNPTGNLVHVGQVAVSISSVTQAAGAVGSCGAGDYVITGSPMTVNAEVPAGTAKGSWSGATIQFNDKTATNQDGCKGATVHLSYTAS
jgi:hypothetical protein